MADPRNAGRTSVSDTGRTRVLLFWQEFDISDIEVIMQAFKILFFFFFFFFFFWAAPVGFPAWGQIGDVVAGLHHSHSNARSEPHLCPTPHSSRQRRLLDPLSEARDRTASSWIVVGFLTL